MKYALVPLFCLIINNFALAETRLEWKPLNEPGVGGWLTSIAVDPADSNHVLIGGDMLGLANSQDGAESWQPSPGFLSYEIANITFNPLNSQEVWAGTMSGPHFSKDGGRSWEPRRQGLPAVKENSYSTPIQQVLYDPDTPNRLLAFGGSWRGWKSPGETMHGWIWESLDGGMNWSEFSYIKRYRNTKWVAAAAGGLTVLYATVEGKGFFKSTDGGKTWNQIATEINGIVQVATHPQDVNVLWISTGSTVTEKGKPLKPGAIWKSKDAGATWRKVVKGLPQREDTNANFATRFSPLTVSQSNPDILYTSDTNWSTPAVYRSVDGGDSWQAAFTRETHKISPTAYPAGIGATVITIDPRNPDNVFCAGSESVVKTTDGGKTWVDASSILTPKPDAPGIKYWAGRGYSGLCSLGIRFNPRNPALTAIIAMDAGRLWISEDSEKSWRYADSGFASSWGGARDVSFGGPEGKTLLGAFGQHGYGGNVGLSEDGGLTFHFWPASVLA